jgi:hypothetical protein
MAALAAALTLAGMFTALGTPGVRAQSAPTRTAALAIGRVASLPLWIASVPEGATVPSAAVLTADGALWWVDASGVSRAAAGVGGEQLATCGDAVLTVDALGRLHRHGRNGSLLMPSTVPDLSLLHRPLCLGDRSTPRGAVAAITADGDVLLLDGDLQVVARARGVRALPDAEVTAFDGGDDEGWLLAVLTDPTQRYRPGALGDEVEPSSLVLLSLPALAEAARWTVEAPAVIEARRPTAWQEGGRGGLHVTVSEERHGARLITLAWAGERLVEVAHGPTLGRTGRWLHLLAAVGARVYAQHQPHQAGPLARYEPLAAQSPSGTAAVGEALPATTAGLEVASHVEGERNLDRWAFVGEVAPGVDLLALPRSDGRAIAWLRCDALACLLAHETSLSSPLATNLVAVGPPGEALGLLAAGEDGTVWWLPTPALAER